MIVLIFLTTPSALFYFLINKSPYLSEVTNLDKIPDNSWESYLFKTFLPPTLILGINRLFFFLIYRASQRERKLRLSRYHRMNLSVSFIYVLMNFMIIPALANQGGTIFEYFR